MTYDWHKIVNRAEFVATGLISRSLDLILDGVGAKTFLITNANAFSITVDDVMLSVEFNGNNPFAFSNRAVYVDANDDVWYGIPVA